MGFLDRDVRNGFDRMFDFNRDGKLDTSERAMQFDYIEHEMSSDSADDSDEDDELDDELEMAGLDRLDLELMDEDERRETLEEVGFDSDDFDF